MSIAFVPASLLSSNNTTSGPTLARNSPVSLSATPPFARRTSIADTQGSGSFASSRCEAISKVLDDSCHLHPNGSVGAVLYAYFAFSQSLFDQSPVNPKQSCFFKPWLLQPILLRRTSHSLFILSPRTRSKADRML